MTTNKYQSGKIYKLTSEHTNKIYVGSTCKKLLSTRLSEHLCDYKRWKNGKRDYLTSFDIFELGSVQIALLENCICETKNELLSRERYWIEHHHDILFNKHIPIRTEEETRISGNEINKIYREINKDRIKQYKKELYENNKEIIAEKNKIYREANKDKLKQQNKEYHEANKDKIKQQRKEYNEANKAKISERNKKYYESKKNI
jgi:hypothetical protein